MHVAYPSGEMQGAMPPAALLKLKILRVFLKMLRENFGRFKAAKYLEGENAGAEKFVGKPKLNSRNKNGPDSSKRITFRFHFSSEPPAETTA